MTEAARQSANVMTSLPNARYERKLLPTGLALPEVLGLVRRHPAGFRQAYPERTVNNIYLDSPSLASYREHVNGAPERKKLRVRWYGEPSGEVETPVLEQKLKQGGVSGKLARRMPPFALNGRPLHETLGNAFTDPCLSDVLRVAVRHLEPTLFNRYRRHYFASGDGRFRLTVDWGLQFARLLKQSGAPRSLARPGPLIVIELKYAPQDADGAALVTNAFPFRVRRCSKYVLGMGAGSPSLR